MCTLFRINQNKHPLLEQEKGSVPTPLCDTVHLKKALKEHCEGWKSSTEKLENSSVRVPCAPLICLTPRPPQCVCIIIQALITRSLAGFSMGFLPSSAHRMGFAHLMSSYSGFCFLLLFTLCPSALFTRLYSSPVPKAELLISSWTSADLVAIVSEQLMSSKLIFPNLCEMKRCFKDGETKHREIK